MRRVLAAVLVVSLLVIASLVAFLQWESARRLDQLTAERSAWRAEARQRRDIVSARASLSAPVEVLGADVPTELGCRLRWVAEQDDRVRRHVARCGAAVKVPADVEAAVRRLKGEALARAAEVPAFESSFEWMSRLRDRSDWRSLAGTPYDFVDGSSEFLAAEAPMPDCGHAVLLAKLRLIAGERAGALDDATLDTLAFAKALLGAPLPNTCGLPVMRAVREQLTVAGRADGALPPPAVIDALATARQAATQAWHPWVEADERAAALASASPIARCVAAFNGLYFTDFGEVLDERYPGHGSAFEAWARTGCASSAFSLAQAAPRPADRLRRVLLGSFGPEREPPAAGLLLRFKAARAVLLEERLAEGRPAPFDAEGRVTP